MTQVEDFSGFFGILRDFWVKYGHKILEKC